MPELLTSLAPQLKAGSQRSPHLVVSTTKRIAEERYFQVSHGNRLFYRHWLARNASARSAIIFLHRGHEHSGRVQHLVDELDLPGFNMFACDARGHGRSTITAPSPVSFATLVSDLDAFVRHISSTHGIPVENIAIVAQSVGSVIAAAWAHDYAPKIRCMVLATPAFRIKLYFPFAYRLLGLVYRLRGDFTINSYVAPGVLTHDPERIASYRADPLITRPVSVRLLLELQRAATRVVADAHAINTPTQVLISGRDFVVRENPQLAFFKRLGTIRKEQHRFDGFYHDVLGEKDRSLAIDKVRNFITSAFENSIGRPNLLNSDKIGYTKAEFDALNRPLPRFSLKKVWYGLMKLGLRIGRRFSQGIRLGFETGFDSGSTLDYVYNNRARGATPFRRLIDRAYLDSIGWRGIRQRKQNLVRALQQSIAELRRQDLPVRILDIAAGHGRYVLEALERSGIEPDSVLLRDFSELNVQISRELIAQKKLQRSVQFERGDAFDGDALASIRPRPTLAIVSGLYELFPDNRQVRDSLTGVAGAIEPGGFLIYTGQPFHPQLEMIARTLPSHRGFRPWVMRRRTQAELDQLVEAAGFRKLSQQIDEWGIFTVSVAQRV